MATTEPKDTAPEPVEPVESTEPGSDYDPTALRVPALVTDDGGRYGLVVGHGEDGFPLIVWLSGAPAPYQLPVAAVAAE